MSNTKNLLLSNEERNRFIQYLEQNIESNGMIIEQLKKIGPHGQLIAQKHATETKAMMIVLKMLKESESFTAG